MNNVLPTASVFSSQVKTYVTDTKLVVDKCIAEASKTPLFNEIYRISLAAHTVLASFSPLKLAPSLNPARSIPLRIPLLVVIGQSSAGLTELRRFVELIVWTVYFTDHPVEFLEFESGSLGFTTDKSKPISFTAHRELSYYLSYLRELMQREPSGIALDAVCGIQEVTRTLNSYVHAGRIARSAVHNPPYDSVDEKDLRKFAKLQRTTFASCCTVLAAFRARRFNQLTAIARAYFDYLVGSAIRKKIRSGPFGLS